MNEVYDIPGFPGYRLKRVSQREWQVIGKRFGKPMALKRQRSGHDYVSLYTPDWTRRVSMQIGRIVLLVLVGPPPTEGHECCHGDGDPLNNDPVNLRWDTPSANNLDAVRHGTCSWLRHPDWIVDAIRAEYVPRAPSGGCKGWRKGAGPLPGSQMYLAEKYGVSQGYVGMVVRGEIRTVTVPPPR